MQFSFCLLLQVHLRMQVRSLPYQGNSVICGLRRCSCCSVGTCCNVLVIRTVCRTRCCRISIRSRCRTDNYHVRKRSELCGYCAVCCSCILNIPVAICMLMENAYAVTSIYGSIKCNGNRLLSEAPSA